MAHVHFLHYRRAVLLLVSFLHTLHQALVAGYRSFQAVLMTSQACWFLNPPNLIPEPTLLPRNICCLVQTEKASGAWSKLRAANTSTQNLGFMSHHSWVAETLSSLSFTKPNPSHLLHPVNFGPEKPKSKRWHASKVLLKLSICHCGCLTMPYFFEASVISLKSLMQTHILGDKELRRLKRLHDSWCFLHLGYHRTLWISSKDHCQHYIPCVNMTPAKI